MTRPILTETDVVALWLQGVAERQGEYVAARCIVAGLAVDVAASALAASGDPLFAHCWHGESEFVSRRDVDVDARRRRHRLLHRIRNTPPDLLF